MIPYGVIGLPHFFNVSTYCWNLYLTDGRCSLYCLFAKAPVLFTARSATPTPLNHSFYSAADSQLSEELRRKLSLTKALNLQMRRTMLLYRGLTGKQFKLVEPGKAQSGNLSPPECSFATVSQNLG